MRKKSIQLHLPEPCHEDWNNMTPVGNGRHCIACQKQVIDFTNMSDQQLIAFFSKRTSGSTCGRFMSYQLDRDIAVPKKRIPWVKYFFQFALPAILASSKAASQGQVKMKTEKHEIVATPKSNQLENAFAAITGKNVSGKVLDEKGGAVPYASIYIKGTSIGTSCDSTGSFSLDYRDPGDSIVLQTSSVGFGTVEKSLSANDNKEGVLISLNTQQELGEVVVTSNVDIRVGRFVGGAFSVVKQHGIFDVIREKIFPAQNSWKFYPNPVQRYSVLTVETTKAAEGNHLFQLLAMNGQIIMNNEVWIDKNNSTVKLDIPSIAAGVYFLRIANKQSGKTITEKIVVE